MTEPDPFAPDPFAPDPFAPDSFTHLNGHQPQSLVDNGDTDAYSEDGEDEIVAPSIYVHGTFLFGDTGGHRLRDISVSIPIQPGDTFADYAVAIEATVREIGQLGYAPGYPVPSIEITETGA